MKNFLALLVCFAIQSCALPAAESGRQDVAEYDRSDDGFGPPMWRDPLGIREGFRLHKDVAQYKGSDYSNVVQVARRISLEEAFDIAQSNPDIDYFVYTKGWGMVLEIPPEVPFQRSQDPFGLVVYTDFIYDSGERSIGYCRIFQRGDTVFFKKDGLWLGSANGLADTYFKE